MRTGKPNLVSLALFTSDDFQKNLDNLIAQCDKAPAQSIIVAPEVTVTGFCYEHFGKAALFAQTIDEALLASSQNGKTIITTLIEEEANHFYNVAKVYSNGTLIHEQKKYKLFPLGEEDLHFKAGKQEAIQTFTIEGLHVGILICFELRFVDLWQQLQGADIIVVPAQWGKPRADHFLTLTKALAIANQCYVIASDATNPQMSAGSGIISPFGEELRNKDKAEVSLTFDHSELKRMRRYINVGIPNG